MRPLCHRFMPCLLISMPACSMLTCLPACLSGCPTVCTAACYLPVCSPACLVFTWHLKRAMFVSVLTSVFVCFCFCPTMWLHLSASQPSVSLSVKCLPAEYVPSNVSLMHTGVCLLSVCLPSVCLLNACLVSAFCQTLYCNNLRSVGYFWTVIFRQEI